MLKSLLGVSSPVYTMLVKMFSGAKKVGSDQFGNTYYTAKARSGYGHERRFVIYRKAPEASLVPPEWHGWLHHQSDTVPLPNQLSFRRPWQKPHLPNMTGTNMAYRPPGHILEGGRRDPASGDYEAWTPDDNRMV